MALLPAVAIVYFVLLGGTAVGEVHPVMGVLVRLSALALVGVALVAVQGGTDRVDKAVVIALVFFSISALLSQFPRQSLDSTLMAAGYASSVIVGRRILSRPEARQLFLSALMTLSLLLSVTTAARWVPVAMQWLDLTGWRGLPPLDLNLDAWPWGHRHDLATLTILLLPSWFMPGLRGWRALAGVVVATLTVPIIILDGSRTLWLALAAATAWLFLPKLSAIRSNRSVVLLTVIVVIGATAALMLSGALAAIVDRLLTVNTLGARSTMWQAATEIFLNRPLSGLGPGAFPWALQEGSYFDLNSWAPRHPDSMLFQLLPETGLLGIAAVMTLLIGVAGPLARSKSRAARWSLAVFTVSGLGANPTDFTFLVAVAIGWIAIALPISSWDDPHSRQQIPPRRRVSMRLATAAAVVAAVAYSPLLAAEVSYGLAREEIYRERWTNADDLLEFAAAADPGMAIYTRQRGALAFIGGQPERAIHHFEDATRINPADDVAWRGLAVAHANNGDAASALRAAMMAVDVQRSDPANMQLALAVAMEAGEADRFVDSLRSEIVHTWPAIVVAPEWDRLAPGSAPAESVRDGLAHWIAGGVTSVPKASQELWLAALAGRTSLLEAAASESPLPAELAMALVGVIRCDDGMSEALDAIRGQFLRDDRFWAIAAQLAAYQPDPTPGAPQIYQLMTRVPLGDARTTEVLNPLNENSGAFSADRWGYRRLPIEWMPTVRLPSPAAGAALWLNDPYAAQVAIRGSEVAQRCRTAADAALP